jgi:hypothetical protein
MVAGGRRLRHARRVSPTSARPNPLRYSRPDFHRLGWALAVALLLHLAGYGAYRSERAYHWLERLHLPHWLARAQQRLVIPLVPKIPPPEREVPLMFVDVDPAQAVAEAPKNAKYYSSKSTRAANPDADQASNQPKINGKQSLVVKTEDVPRAERVPLQPAVPPSPQTKPQPEQQRQPQAEAKKSLTPGDLAFARSEALLREAKKQEELQPQPKPRTIVEALSRPQNSAIAGERMRQDGGVQPHAERVSLDVAGTSFGAYDAALVAAIQSRWYSLLDAQRLTRATGRVVVSFRLHDDGTITDMVAEDSTVDVLLSALCQRAVIDPAPYAPWPSDMRRQVGESYRDVHFTFFYN